jgi:hypothetical protein
MGLLLLLLLAAMFVAVVPSWRYSRDWGYGPSGGLALVLVVVVVLVYLGYIPGSF